MSMSRDEIASLYRHCDYCGEAMCTEDPAAIFVAATGGIERYWYCCPECLEWAEQDARDIEQTNASLSAERLNRL